MSARTTRVRLRDVAVRFRLAHDRQRGIGDFGRDLLRGRLFERRSWHTALEGIDLELGDGDIVGVIGRNGSGKTTLLRVIGGMIAPNDGTVDVQGRISSLLSIGAGADLQSSGRRNIWFQALLHGLDADRIETLVPRIVEFAELGDLIDVPMKFYSSGMISRLGFAIVLALEPDILLVDEILSVGDLAFRRRAESAMDDLLSRSRCQIIVTHDLALVREHCTRCLLLDAGKIVALGDPSEVADHYEEASNAIEAGRLSGVARSREQELDRTRSFVAGGD